MRSGHEKLEGVGEEEVLGDPLIDGVMLGTGDTVDEEDAEGVVELEGIVELVARLDAIIAVGDCVAELDADGLDDGDTLVIGSVTIEEDDMFTEEMIEPEQLSSEKVVFTMIGIPVEEQLYASRPLHVSDIIMLLFFLYNIPSKESAEQDVEFDTNNEISAPDVI